jgi:hypothetical protein
VRVVNSLFQANVSDTIAVAIDVLIDSTPAAPSLFGLAAAGRSAGDSANGYQTFARGVHSFVTRRAGDTGPNGSVYTTTTNLPFLPQLFLTAGTYYTMIVAGIIPATGPIPNNTIPFTLLIDDPFPGPTYNAVLQARLRVINAAPYADPDGGDYGSVQIYITPGNVLPVDPSVYAPMGTAYYRNAIPATYLNLNPGTYGVTLVGSGTGAIVARQTITVAAGEVRTLILQSTASGAPSVSNHILTSLLDHQY